MATYVDLDIAFSRHPYTKDVAVKIDTNAVIQSVKNLVQLNAFEKPRRPEIHSGVRALLFNNIDPITATALERAVREVINNFEPRVEIQQISVDPKPERNEYRVGVTFNIVNRPEPITVEVFLERLR